MKILLYGVNYAPELTGVGKYTSELANWLANYGFQIRVVTAPPYYPDWFVHSGYSSFRWTREKIDGVDVFRCPLWVPMRPTGFNRIVHLLSFAVSSLPIMLKQCIWKPDIVWIVEPPLFCAPTALAVARLSRARAWLHVQDFEVDAAFSLGLLKSQNAKNLIFKAERLLMRRFDRVSTISRMMKARLLAKGVNAKNVVLAPNWVNLSSFTPCRTNAANSIRIDHGIPDNAIVALYSGNMGSKQGLEILADVARICSDSSLLAARSIFLYFVAMVPVNSI